MFRDLNGYYERPDRPRPALKLTPSQEKLVLFVVLFNILVLVVAPIGGVSMLEVFTR